MTVKIWRQSSLQVNKLEPIFSYLLIPIFFIVLVVNIMPIAQPFEFDTDEGFNLIKAFLYSNGFSLYTDIWNDQPPFLTGLLRVWFSVFGSSYLSGRLLVLLFSTLLIWSFYQSVRVLIGFLPALTSTLLLIFSHKFIQLSASVMVGLPSLSLAMLAIYLLILYTRTSHLYLAVFSGISLALSLQTKVFTVFLIPIMLLYVLGLPIIRHKERKVQSYNNFRAIALWLCAIVVTYVVIGLLFNAINYEQLINTHLSSTVEKAFENRYGFGVLFRSFRNDRALILLAFLGTLVIFIERRWEAVFPLAWLGAASFLLWNHRPIWYHHYPLLSIPLAWLAAYGVMPLFQLLHPRSWRLNSRLNSLQLKRKINRKNVKNLLLSITAIVLLIPAIAKISSKTKLAFALQKPNYDANVVALLSQSKDQIRWVFTDRPVYAFQAGLLVPPEIAVFSGKRFESGNLDDDDLLRILKSYQPERIILARFKDRIYASSEISNYIEDNYTQIYQTEIVDMYERNF